MVGPTQRRAVVDFVRADFDLSQRRACAIIGQARATQRYRARRVELVGLREKLIELAAERPRFGYPRLHVLLRRAGFKVNRKRVYRLYRDAGLKLRAKRRKRGARAVRGPLASPTRPLERWSIDFVADRLSSGRMFRVLTVVDDVSKVCPAIEVDLSLSSLRVIRALERAIEVYGKPAMLVMDNGPEFTSRAFDAWAYARGIQLHWIDPGRPVQNAYVESFNARFRDECLNVHHFADLADARALIETWREDYNDVRPHTALGGRTPNEFLSLSEGGMPPSERELVTLPIHPNDPSDSHPAWTELGDRLTEHPGRASGGACTCACTTTRRGRPAAGRRAGK